MEGYSDFFDTAFEEGFSGIPTNHDREDSTNSDLAGSSNLLETGNENGGLRMFDAMEEGLIGTEGGVLGNPPSDSTSIGMSSTIATTLSAAEQTTSTGPKKRTRTPRRPILEGNNKYGRNGTEKCSNCRKYRQKCVYDDVNDTCTYCSRRGLPCSEKDLARPQHQKQIQKNEPRLTSAAFEVPLPGSIDSSAVMASKETFAEAVPVLRLASVETGSRSILSILSAQKEMLREWAIKLHTLIPQDGVRITGDHYWEFLPPGLAEILLHVDNFSEIDFNDSNEWSLRLGFLILGCGSEDDPELRDIVLRITNYLLENCGRAYARLRRGFSILKLISDGTNFKDGSNSNVEYSPIFYVRSKKLLTLDDGKSSYTTILDRVPQIPSSQSSSWISRCITSINSAISNANESVNDVGKAINVAVNLFSSLRSLSVGTRDTSLEGIYLSELILHINSLDLKGAWSRVSDVWSKFVNNIGRMLSGLKVPGHDGFLGNYPVHIV